MFFSSEKGKIHLSQCDVLFKWKRKHCPHCSQILRNGPTLAKSKCLLNLLPFISTQLMFLFLLPAMLLFYFLPPTYICTTHKSQFIWQSYFLYSKFSGTTIENIWGHFLVEQLEVILKLKLFKGKFSKLKLFQVRVIFKLSKIIKSGFLRHSLSKSWRFSS